MSFHRLTPSTAACSATELSTSIHDDSCISMWAPTSHWESVKLERLICIFVLVSKVFNESWRRPVWQIRWAPRWERHRELWRRRRLRLKPEAQSSTDQHLRQRVTKLCRSLSPFFSPFSASSFSFFSISSYPAEVSHIILQSIPHPFIDSALVLTCGQSQQSWQNVRSQQHFQQRHTIWANSK